MGDAGYSELAMKKEYEKRVCKAVIEIIKKRKNLLVDKIEYPDEKERNKQAVDVLLKCSSREIVLEHTRIESYPQQIKDWSQIRKLLKPLEEMLTGKLPAPGHYELSVDVGATKGAKHTKVIQKALIKWIKEKAPLLQPGSPDVAPDHYKREKPDGVPFEVTLYRWPGNNGKFWIMEDAPADLAEKKRERIREALEEKSKFHDRIVFALLGQRAHNVTARVMKLRAVDCAVHVFYNTEKEKSQKRRIR